MRIKRLRIWAKGDNLELQKRFGVTRATVCNALAGRTKSRLAMQIREAALEMDATTVKRKRKKDDNLTNV